MQQTPQQQSAPKPPPPPSRMRLDSLIKGKIKQRTRVLLYGPEGVGKTTFGSGAPKPVFLGAEDGSAQLDVTRFPTPESWDEVLQAVRTLGQEKHDFDTLVLDTLDWMEPLVWGYVCDRDKKGNIEDYGFGKGYQAALEEWRRFLSGLEWMRAQKPMHVVMLAHSWVKPFKNPTGEDYDRYELKLHAKAAGLLKEWSDAVLFSNWETFAKKDERTKRVRGVSTGSRLIYTERTAAYDAKNRYSLPPEIPLSWAEFEAAIETGAVAPASDLRAEIERKAKELGGDMERAILETVARAGDNAQSLALINNKVNARLAERTTNNNTAPSAEKAS